MSCASTTGSNSTRPKGLNRQAVHLTVMCADEGLVGLVASEASPINLSDTALSNHFRDGTGA